MLKENIVWGKSALKSSTSSCWKTFMQIRKEKMKEVSNQFIVYKGRNFWKFHVQCVHGEQHIRMFRNYKISSLWMIQNARQSKQRATEKWLMVIHTVFRHSRGSDIAEESHLQALQKHKFSKEAFSACRILIMPMSHTLQTLIHPCMTNSEWVCRNQANKGHYL